MVLPMKVNVLLLMAEKYDKVKESFFKAATSVMEKAMKSTMGHGKMITCMDMGCISTFPVQFIQVIGKMDSTMGRVLMNSLKARSILANGNTIKCMVREYSLILKENSGREYLFREFSNLNSKRNLRCKK